MRRGFGGGTQESRDVGGQGSGHLQPGGFAWPLPWRKRSGSSVLISRLASALGRWQESCALRSECWRPWWSRAPPVVRP
jgi:hypothetical protein